MVTFVAVISDFMYHSIDFPYVFVVGLPDSLGFQLLLQQFDCVPREREALEKVALEFLRIPDVVHESCCSESCTGSISKDLEHRSCTGKAVHFANKYLNI